MKIGWRGSDMGKMQYNNHEIKIVKVLHTLETKQ
jgi:hypothetical protein